MTILIYAAFNLVAALISYPAGSLSDTWGRKNILLASFVIFLIAYLGFALTQNILVVAALFVVYGLYQGIFRAAGKALAADFVPEHLRASGVGWYSTSVGFVTARGERRCGIGSATPPCYISAPPSPWWGALLWVCWCRRTLGSANPWGCQAQV